MIIILFVLCFLSIGTLGFFLFQSLKKISHLQNDIKVLFAIQKIRGYALNEVRSIALEFEDENKKPSRKTIDDLYSDEKLAFEAQLQISMPNRTFEQIKKISDIVYPLKKN